MSVAPQTVPSAQAGLTDWTEPTNEELGIRPASGLPLLFLWLGVLTLSLGLWAALLWGGWSLLK